MNATHSQDIEFPTHPKIFGYLFWIFGFFGAHRFYFGKPLTGVLWFCTGGLLLVGWIVDLFFISSMSDEASRRYRPGPLDYSVTWLLHFFLGIFGVHRIYMGKFISGVIYFLTAGLFGVGYIYDMLTLNTQIEETNARLAARVSN
ncbi:MAG: TM2 domain-containing protein [Pirellulaceae bacterium]|nr:TM2 domain-containing protein [Pirellulaceae bacterium]